MTRARRMAMIPKIRVSVAALLLTFPSAALSQADDAQQAELAVSSFYGVPLDLTLWTLEKLPYRSKLGWGMDEGVVFPTATIFGPSEIQLDASFDEGGNLYMLETSSAGAVGPRGVRVGSTLADVRKAWPNGKLVWGQAHGRYATFDTGEKIYFQFSPQCLPPEAWEIGAKENLISPSIKVTTIRLAAKNRESG